MHAIGNLIIVHVELMNASTLHDINIIIAGCCKIIVQWPLENHAPPIPYNMRTRYIHTYQRVSIDSLCRDEANMDVLYTF